LYGYRVFKGVVVIYSAVAGAAAGYWIAVAGCGRPDFWWIGLIGGGLLLAILAWPLVNFFVAVWGAVAGGVIGAAVTRATAGDWPMLLAVAIGVVVGAVLAVLIFRFMIVLTTSVLGSAMAVVGLVAILYHVAQIKSQLHPALMGRHYVLPLVVAGPALVGLVYQLYHSEGRDGGDDQDAGQAKGKKSKGPDK